MGIWIYLSSICLFTMLTGYASSVPAQIQFYSQASQDAFVHALLYDIDKKADEGHYLEIGSAHPVFLNNTYFFEKYYKWKGISIDVAPEYRNPWSNTRQNPLLVEDATRIDYSSILESFPNTIDFLSLDTDGHYDNILKLIPFHKYTFKVIAIEHDFYRYGDFYREKEREILASLGYFLLCPDVCHPAVGSFEDWWIHPSAFSEEIFAGLTSLDLEQKYHDEIVSILRARAADFPH